MNFVQHLNIVERVGTVQNTIPDELERYGLFKKSKARVAKHDDQSKEHHHETLESKLKQELELKAKDLEARQDSCKFVGTVAGWTYRESDPVVESVVGKG